MISAFFRPARNVMGRLSYAKKIVAVVLVMAIPLGYAMTLFIQADSDQIGFSAKERQGVEYLTPVVDLTTAVVEARHASVASGVVSTAKVQSALAAVTKVDDRIGAALNTTAALQEVTKAVSAATSATGSASDVYQDWTAAAGSVVALASAAADGSNLTLDPDLDSYYVMDAVAFRFPLLLTDLNSVLDNLTIAQATGTPAAVDAARLRAASTLGSITTTLAAVQAGLAKSVASTENRAVQAKEKDISATVAQVSTLTAALNAAVSEQDTSKVTSDDVAAASALVQRMWAGLLPDLDDLLSARVDGYKAATHKTEIVAAVFVLLAGYLVVGFYQSAVPSMRRMRDTLQSIADGDLRARVLVDTRDEIGQMGQALNETTSALAGSIAAILDSAVAVEEASGDTSRLAGDLQGAATATKSQVSESVRNVAGVTEHAQSVAAAGEEMSATIREISHGASDAAVTAHQAVSTAESTGVLVSRLTESTEAINQVVKMITAVAGQTRLLSLNASIEAARAGEAGKGFAVVAEEVKTLAEETARAAAEITTRVEAIQADSGSAAEAIAQISTVITRVNDIQTTIAAAVEEQDAAMNELGRDVSRVATAAGEINTSMTVVESSAVVSADRAQEVGAVAERLAGSARSLQESVSRFTV